MVSNDLRMWMMGGSDKEAPMSSGQKNVGFLPVVALAQYALEDTEPFVPAPNPAAVTVTEPEGASVTEIEEASVTEPEGASVTAQTEISAAPAEISPDEILSADESPIQHEEILESEPIPYLEISRMDDELEERAEELRAILRRKLEAKHAKPEPEAIKEPQPEKIKAQERELNEILVSQGNLDDQPMVDLLTHRFREIRKSKVSRVRRNRLLIALLVLIVCIFGAWRFLSSDKIDATNLVSQELPDTVAPQFDDGYVFTIPFVPSKPMEPPKYGPLLSNLPIAEKTQQNAVTERSKPASKQPKPVPPKATSRPPKKPNRINPVPKPVSPAPVSVPESVPQPSFADNALFEDIRNKEYRKAISQSRQNLVQNPHDRLSLFALGLALYGFSDFSGARDAFYQCLFLDSPRLPNITVGNFSLIQNASNRRIPIPKAVLDDIAPLLRATQINPNDRAIYINLALSNLKSASSMNTAKLYNMIFVHAEKRLIQEYGDTLEYYPHMTKK